tara:strand:- start:115954 stop:116166 length:213 start_codon:yes stop_codon:yes gene_type:complete
MLCNFEPDRRLGVFVCQVCGHQSKTLIERECDSLEDTKLEATSKKKGCGCGKRRSAQRKAQERWNKIKLQ